MDGSFDLSQYVRIFLNFGEDEDVEHYIRSRFQITNKNGGPWIRRFR
jgi:hypothetical protein